MTESLGRIDGPGFSRGDFASGTMAEPQSSKGERRKLDALTSAAVGFFLLAVGFTAWVAMHSSPVLLATLMLLAGLTGVACLGLFVLRGASEPAADGARRLRRGLAVRRRPAARRRPVRRRDHRGQSRAQGRRRRRRARPGLRRADRAVVARRRDPAPGRRDRRRGSAGGAAGAR